MRNQNQRLKVPREWVLAKREKKKKSESHLEHWHGEGAQRFYRGQRGMQPPALNNVLYKPLKTSKLKAASLCVSGYAPIFSRR